jgi:CHAD domain-containing protein
LKERVRTTFEHLPKALAGDRDEIHEMRVAARRLRTALPMLAGKPKGKRVRSAARILRAVARAGGLSRDLDVGLELFDARLAATSPAGSEAKALRRALVAARNRSRKRMTEGLLDLDIKGLREDLKGIQKRGGEPVFTVFVRLRKEAQKMRAGIFAELDSLGSGFDAERLHGVRTRCRQLRYLAEILDAIRGQESPVPGRLRELQDVLGRLHDAHVLSSWLDHRSERARAAGRPTLASAAHRECLAFLETCRELHGRFLASDPKRVLDEALQAMVPSRSAA